MLLFCSDLEKVIGVRSPGTPSGSICSFRCCICGFSSASATVLIGPAGTTHLGTNAVWWDHEKWKQGFHRGRVFHVHPDTKKPVDTLYGFPGNVVALDGLFLGARAKTIQRLGLEKPEYFEGEWDFYDIHYTTKAFQLGYTNKAVDIKIIHHSLGELAGRDSWHKNREAFISKTELPLKIEE